MPFWKRLLTQPLRFLEQLFDRFRYRMKKRLRWGTEAPITVASYGGYASEKRAYLQGRVLRDKLIIATVEDSRWRNLINAYKRFGSAEIPGATLEVKIGQNHFRLETDEEGYFRIDQRLEHPLTQPNSGWHPVEIRLTGTPFRAVDQTSEGQVRFPGPRASLGVISDIDDTILKTDVTFPLKLKAIYHTILKNAGNRRTFQEVAAFYQALALGPDRHADNPFFYVSRSPWNLHDLLEEFLSLNGLPAGPLLLRDFGLPAEPAPTNFRGHKYQRIAHLLQIYPTLPFVLIGDSGERDTDIYLEVNRDFPGRIAAIYIRDVRSRSRARRIRDLIGSSGEKHVHLIRTYGEAAVDAAQQGLIDYSFFESLRGKSRGLF